MSGLISYPRTDGSDRINRDLERIEKLLEEIERCLNLENLEGILALITLVGWQQLPEHMRIRYLGLLAQKSRELDHHYKARFEAGEPPDLLALQKLDKVMQDIDVCLLTHGRWEARRDQEPLTIEGVRARIEGARTRIDEQGYQPLFTDDEIAALAKSDAVAKARYKVRFMERKYLADNGRGRYLGVVFEGQYGQGVKYWNTSFSQIEDADTDHRLIAGKLGLDYDEGVDYVLLIIDSEKTHTLCDAVSVSATFENLGAFASRELPELYPPVLVSEIMTAAFQAEYLRLYLSALAHWGTSRRLTEFQFNAFLNTCDMESARVVLFIERLRMHTQIGNNQYFRGDGVTENLIKNSAQKLGVVELFTFENRTVELDAYLSAGAVYIIQEGQ